MKWIKGCVDLAFVDKFEENIEKLENVYDLVSFCYDFLMEQVANETAFLANYIFQNEEARTFNQNLKLLEAFQGQVMEILKQQDKNGYIFQQCRVELLPLSQIISKQLKTYMDSKLNDATIPFFILMAVNIYVLEKRGKCKSPGPLNMQYQEKSYVYLNINESILQEAAYVLGFGQPIQNETIRKQLGNLHILQKDELRPNSEPVKIVQFSILEDDKDRQKILNTKKLKIAVIPFGREKMLEFPMESGAAFNVAYNEWHKKFGIKRALRLLEEAIKKQANIIIFPEYICSEEIQSKIQKYLQEKMDKNSSTLERLLLVVAGTAWTFDNNNVSILYQYNGKQLGKQYKGECFSDLKKEKREMIENLSQPGKENIIVDINGIGKIMVAICRDVSNRGYLRNMTEIFKPQFLFVPAWSPSVNKGFREQLKEITAFNYCTCAIVCNCCEALESSTSFKKENGVAVTPYKVGSVVEGKEHIIYRNENKCSELCEGSGCFFMIEQDFSNEAVQEGKIIRKMSQYF